MEAGHPGVEPVDASGFAGAAAAPRFFAPPAYTWSMAFTFVPIVFFFILSITVTVLLIPRMLRGMKRGREEARDQAGRLNLEYVDGVDALRRSYVESGQTKALEAFDKMPAFIRSFAESAAPWRMEGSWKGVRVSVYRETRSSGKSSRTYVVTKAFYPAPLPFKFRAAREGTMAKIGKALFGLKDVQIGDPDFDPKVRIRSEDEAAAVSLFFREAAASAFLALLERFPDAVADSSSVTRERQASLLPDEELKEVLDLLAAFAAEAKV